MGCDTPRWRASQSREGWSIEAPCCMSFLGLSSNAAPRPICSTERRNAWGEPVPSLSEILPSAESPNGVRGPRARVRFRPEG